MKNINLRVVLSAVCLVSIMAAFVKVEAGPVRFDQVVQILNARPGKAETSSFTRIRVRNYYDGIIVRGDDDDTKKQGTQKQDGRVITETRTDIVNDDICDCVDDVKDSKFPKWALLGLAAIPIAFVLIKRKKDTPTPTPTPTTPTPTPTVTPTPTPPEPVPEPMTILLFGTGLASIGFAARRKFGKKGNEKEKDEE